MTDIVARLRPASLSEYGLDIDKELMDEAADEIERLQTANGYAFGELAKLRAENERLKARIDGFHRWYEPMRAELEQARAARVYDVMCQCGHTAGNHNQAGTCVVYDCSCVRFEPGGLAP